jgi:hypothetical protein
MSLLLKLAMLFGGLSLLAVGGGNAVLPDMQRFAVEQHWMTERDFLALFTLSRVAPGPGSLIVTLIGQRVAGVPGAAVATLAMFFPSCLLVHLLARFWQRMRGAPWRSRAGAGGSRPDLCRRAGADAGYRAPAFRLCHHHHLHRAAVGHPAAPAAGAGRRRGGGVGNRGMTGVHCPPARIAPYAHPCPATASP